MICEETAHDIPFLPCAPQQNSDGMKEFTLLKKLSQTKFPVFLAHCPNLDNYFALKVFAYEDGEVSPYFLNEIAFSNIRHRNIISILHHQTESEFFSQETGAAHKSSFLVMEFAPYGDFFDLLISSKVRLDEILVRTYFHQLIEGLEHIQEYIGAHLDLKLENLLIGENFELKIADFDNSYIKGRKRVPSKGTRNYRAPEIIDSSCRDFQAADIYSAGILLFVLKCGGTLPHCEQQKRRGSSLTELLYKDNSAFWMKHAEIQDVGASFFDQDFIDLFNQMTKIDPRKRINISEIKKSNWYNGPICNQEELSLIMQEKIASH